MLTSLYLPSRVQKSRVLQYFNAAEFRFPLDVECHMVSTREYEFPVPTTCYFKGFELQH